jgi:galactokinase
VENATRLNPIVDIQTLFKRHFGYTPAHVVRAPAWLELLGSATVDARGLSLSVAVDQYVHIASAPRSDGKIELLSSLSPDHALFWMSQLAPAADPPWLECMKSILSELRRRGVHFSGFNAAISFPANGLSLDSGESPAYAALQVATALTIRRLHPFHLTETGSTIPPRRNSKGELPPLDAPEKTSVAQLCYQARPKHPGTEPGLLGPLTCLFGKAWHILSIDLQSLTVEQLPFIGEVFVRSEAPSTPHPASPRPDADFENRAYALSAAQKLGARSLRAVELKAVEAHKTNLAPREYECARHFTSEVQRLIAAERALRADDHRQFGQYLLDSHKSAQKLSRNADPNLDLFVKIATAHPGCLGARVKNSGTLSLVSFHQVESFMAQVSAEFQKGTGLTAATRLLRSSDGASD